MLSQRFDQTSACRRRGARLMAAAIGLATLCLGGRLVAEDLPADPVLRLDEPVLSGRAAFPSGWRLRFGDDPGWAAPDLDDSAWHTADRFVFRRTQALPEDWQPVAWLRCALEVDAALVGRPLAISVSQLGALQIFIDGHELQSLGTVAVDQAGRAVANLSVPEMQETPAIVVFDRPGRHQLALRYVNPELPSILRTFGVTGIRLSINSAPDGIADALAGTRFQNLSLGWFCGLFFAFGLLHLLLYLFYPAIRANLDFALLCFVLGGLVFFLIYRFVQKDPGFLRFSEPALNQLGLLVGLTSLRFVYRLFYDRRPRFFAFYAALAVPLSIWGLVTPDAALHFVFLYMLVSTCELMRVVVVAVVARKPGARLIGAGAFSLALGFSIGLLANLDFLPRSLVTNFLIPFSSMGVLLVCMSIYLSRSFAAVHRDLEARLEEVERLSAETLEQERRLRTQAVEQGVLEERYEQKVRELEEARQLQLSMLPKEVPELPDLEIATHMQTATEVGGDYYDFDLDADGTLIIAIGDATGHGMRAGTMVIAAKSLFNVLASSNSLVDTLSRSTRAIKRMNLRKLAMALTLVRYREGELLLSAAGMPPAMIYRAATGEVEQVELGGMPLGAMASFPYQEARIDLQAGDTVLLMSDGFPERLNGDQEMLGYELASERFAALATGSATEVVAGLREAEQSWAGDTPADDDVTFVVLRRLPAAASAQDLTAGE